MLRNIKSPQLADQPNARRRNPSRKYQPRHTPERALGYALKGAVLLAGCQQADRLQSAHVAGDEREDGHADAALQQHADDGVLQEPWGGAFGGGGLVDIIVEGAHEVCYEDGEGGDAAEGLEFGNRSV